MSEAPGEERAHKRSAAAGSNPLHDRDILQLILNMVGPAEHVFLSTVSKSFRECYLNVPALVGVYPDFAEGDGTAVTFGPQTTACTVIFESVSRIRLAVELGFVVNPRSWWCQFNAGCAADIETLATLKHVYNVPYTEYTSRGAAESGSVSKLQWLLDEQQCPEAADIIIYAQYAPTLDVLKWLKQRGCVFTEDTCAAAAKSPRAASLLQYLRSEGVAFDASLMVTAIRYQELPLVQWLHEHGGCPLSEEAVLAAANLEDLTALSWLHSVDCPCDYNFLCLAAASNGAIALLQWIKDNGVVNWSPAVLTGSLNVAGVNQQLEAAQVCG
jgi:hypothetical protein